VQAPTSELGNAKTALLAALAVFAVGYIVVLIMGVSRARQAAARAATPGQSTNPGPAVLATGFFTNFWDTLGIGSYATTTAIFRFWRLVPDEQIPGTLNVGHTLPTIIQAFIFTQLVPVDARTLVLMIAAAIAGAWLGAGVVASWPRRKIQLGMGLALFGFAAIQLVNLLQFAPAGGTALALSGSKLIIAIAVNFMLGALMTLGIGLYAPCMILVSLLGMNPIAAFPIMMGSCAFLMPVASARFVKSGSFNPKAVLGLLVGGIPAVLIAALIVKSLPLTAVKWLVVVVVVYTATTLLRAALRDTAAPELPLSTSTMA
jgi:uncharacterized membrane protein YfcA